MTNHQTAASTCILNTVHLVKILFFRSSPFPCLNCPSVQFPTGSSPTKSLWSPSAASPLPQLTYSILYHCLWPQHPASHPVPTPFIPVTYALQFLPGVSNRKAPPLSDALIDHQLAEESRGASGRQFGRRGVALPSSHTWDFGRLQLQVHVLLECSDTGVHLDAQLVGRHPCSLQFFTSSVQTNIRQLA